MISIEDFRGLSDDAYIDALLVDQEIVGPLHIAAREVEEALVGVEDTSVDSAEQRAYIRLQIDDMMYELRKIRSRVEG